ncbi:hypothetical protein BJY52DRAFT_1279527 [Lactarius psammicola]|nr:hypothetical protein BJY52DRAFT_1279527 [Lactarius psammicola]
MPRSNKRKRVSRVQAEILDEDDAPGVVSVPPEDDELDTEKPEPKEESVEASHRPEVEAELWDLFREEFHEAVEQLPLYLHRTYALLRELDEQVTGKPLGAYNEILPSLQKYIQLRRSLAWKQDVKPLNEQGHPPESEDKQLADTNSDAKETTGEPNGETTRGHLRHIGWLMEEVVRGSQEKVGLAQAAYDSVDRHIRQLDQSIREQEMSISFGLRQGTHPSLLPDLAAPSRWARPSRVTHSPIPGLSDDEDITAPKISVSSEVTIGMATGSEATRGPPSKKGKKGKKKKLDKAVSETEVAPGTVALPTRSLRLKVPPLNSIAQANAAADPDEPKYCYCNRVSFGNMVACDYPQCKREWFHLDCVGLTEEPQSRTWYCRDCEPLVRKTEQGGTRRRGR